MSVFANRICSLTEQLPDDVDGVIITSQVNRYYFTGLDIDNGYLIITRSGSCLITDSRYIETAKKTLEGICEAAVYYAELGELLCEKCAKLNADTLLMENDNVTISQYHQLEKLLADSVELVSDDRLDGIIHSMRVSKDNEELELVREAQRITERSFNKLLGSIREGVSERELALELEFDMRRSGAQSVSFDLIVAAGANGSMPHAVPTDYCVRSGDFITFDIGATVGGYHSDMTRTVALGTVSDEQRIVYETVKQAQRAAIEYLMDGGIDCRLADKAARDVIANAGYGANFGHSTGHGVGLEIHEAPSLSTRANGDIPERAIVTVEPGIYLEGRFGVRIEDMIYVSQDGCIDLTDITRELIVL